MSDELTKLRALIEAKTAGPWRACHDGDCQCGLVWSLSDDVPVAQSWPNNECFVPSQQRRSSDARAIAALGTLGIALLEVAEDYERKSKTWAHREGHNKVPLTISTLRDAIGEHLSGRSISAIIKDLKAIGEQS